MTGFDTRRWRGAGRRALCGAAAGALLLPGALASRGASGEGEIPGIIYADDAARWQLEPYACLRWYNLNLQGPRLESCAHRSGARLAADGQTLYAYGFFRDVGMMEIAPDGPALNMAGFPDHPGYADGPAELARFGGFGHMGTGRMIADGKGGYYLADWGNQCIRRLFLKDGKDWWVETVAGEPARGAGWEEWRDGTLRSARFRCVQTLALDSKGNIVALDSNRLRYVDLAAGTVTTLNPDWGGKGYSYGFQDGPLAGAQFSWIMFGGSDIDREKDLLYVADSWNMRIRRVDLRKGIVSTVLDGKGKTKARGVRDGSFEEAVTGPCHDVQWDPFRKRLILKEMDCKVGRVVDPEKKTVRSWAGTYDVRRQDMVRKGAVPYPMPLQEACMNYVTLYSIGERDIYLGNMGLNTGAMPNRNTVCIGRAHLEESPAP